VALAGAAAGAEGVERAERAAGAALAADSAGMPAPGALRAATCVTCHGAARPVPGSQIPRLAGLPAGRIEQAMRDYAARAEAGDLMGQIARGYDAQTVALIARWYAGLAPEAP
jgi:cytochrome c553